MSKNCLDFQLEFPPYMDLFAHSSELGMTIRAKQTPMVSDEVREAA